MVAEHTPAAIGLTGTVAEPRCPASRPSFPRERVPHPEGGSSWEIGIDDPRWTLPTGPGRHEAALTTRTSHGMTRPGALAYEVH
jgi:hypothetical protein